MRAFTTFNSGIRAVTVNGCKLHQSWRPQAVAFKQCAAILSSDITSAQPPSAVGSSSGSNALSDLLKSMILMRGPMTLSDWMRTCLGHPHLGYYMTGDVFGLRGDFITSPEISQLFGELVGIWLVAYTMQSHPHPQQPLALIEMGPGRGTLAQDVLRVFARFPALAQRVTALHLVETSPALRRMQASALHCEKEASDSTPGEGGTGRGVLRQAQCSKEGAIPGLRVQWHDRLSDVPIQVADSPPAATLLLAHELFDALPVHQLVWTGQGKGWRERLVDVDTLPPLLPAAGASANTAAASTSSPSAATSTLLGPDGQPLAPVAAHSSPPATVTGSKPATEVEEARFKLVLASAVTPAAAAYAQWLSNKQQVRAARSGSDIAPQQHQQQQTEPDAQQQRQEEAGGQLAEGTVAEFSPASIDLGRQIALRLSATGGCALLMDYGYSDSMGVDGQAREGTQAAQGAGFWTLRGIHKHQFVDFLSRPGAVDLSVDVDFSALASAMEAVDRDVSGGTEEGQGKHRVTAWGPITQGVFLQRMGLAARLQRLLSSPAAAGRGDVQQRLIGEAERLAHPNQMGSVYKVMAVTASASTGASAPPAAYE